MQRADTGVVPRARPRYALTRTEKKQYRDRHVDESHTHEWKAKLDCAVRGRRKLWPWTTTVWLSI